MATSRKLRFACIAAIVALGLTLAYWGMLWWGGPTWIEPTGGHDGGMCRAVVTTEDPGRASGSAPCGVSMTVAFASALFAIALAGVSGTWGLARRSSTAMRIAAVASAYAFCVASFEALQTVRGTWVDGLGPKRGPIHMAILGLAFLVFIIASGRPRNRETAPAPSPASE